MTDEATSYINATYDDQVRRSSLPLSSGRVLRTSSALGVFDAVSASRQAGFFRIVSVIEAYVDTLSAALFAERTPGSHELVRRLVAAAELRSSRTWAERKSAFANYHEVPLSQVHRWDEVSCATEVRNAIAHGLGRLTARQRTAGVAAKFKRIDVGLSDGAIVVTEASLRRCRDFSVEFIRDLDIKAPMSP